MALDCRSEELRKSTVNWLDDAIEVVMIEDSTEVAVTGTFDDRLYEKHANELKELPEGASELFKKVTVANEEDRLEDAAAHCDELLRIAPESFFSHFFKWMIEARRENLEIALKHIDKVLAIEPKLLDVWDTKGDIHSDLGQWEESLEAFREIVKLDADIEKAWFSIGMNYMELQRYDEATKAFRKCAALYKEQDCLAGYSNAAAYQFMELLAKAGKSDEFNSILYSEGLELLRSQQYDQAIDLFQKVIHFDPYYDRRVYLALAMMLHEQEKNEEALDVLKDGLEHFEHDELLLLWEFRVLEALGRDVKVHQFDLFTSF